VKQHITADIATEKFLEPAGRRDAAFGQPAHVAVSSSYQTLG